MQTNDNKYRFFETVSILFAACFVIAMFLKFMFF